MSIKSEDVKRVENETTGEAFIDARAQIKNVEPPTHPGDVANKSYTDTAAFSAGASAIANITDQFPALMDDAGGLRIVNDEVDAGGARIVNAADTDLTTQSDAVTVNDLSSAINALEMGQVVRNIESQIDAQSASIINVASANMTDQTEAVNVDTLTDQIDALNMDQVVRNVSSEIDASSARIKNLANAVLTNQGDAVNVGSVKPIFADSAPSVDLVSIDLITPTLNTLSDVTPILKLLADAINSLEQAVAGQDIISIPS